MQYDAINKSAEQPIRVRYDYATEKWFKAHPDVCSTVMRCKDCGLFYKPSLGHKCKVRKAVKHAE